MKRDELFVGLLPRSLLLLGLILLAGILFRSFFLENLVEPAALAAWWLVRAFVSIDQRYYWGGLLLVAVALAIHQMMEDAPGAPAEPSAGPADRNITLQDLKAWRDAIHHSERSSQGREILKRRLAELLVAAYRTQLPHLTPLEVQRALQDGEVPLPAAVSALLFPAKPERGGRLKSILGTPRKWLRRWTGQERAARQRAVDETLAWIETTLEDPYGTEWKP